MASSKHPAVWLPGVLISQGLQNICPDIFGPSVPAQWRRLGMFGYWIVFMLAMAWLRLVSENVAEPYLDEIFHIPQAQLYCKGQFDYWDPKLTTPPGLYIFATILAKLRMSACTVFDLRLFNATILPLTMVVALSCRHLIQKQQPSQINHAISIHTAVNIALFPPLFFFSGLFYTDLLSTLNVLVVYGFFLYGEKRSNWAVLPAGTIALTMRQTNIFWVAVFLGGLEAVRTVSRNPAVKKDDYIVPGYWKDRVRFEVDKWSRGNIHDISLTTAGISDYVLCILSIVVAAAHRPLQLIVRLWPYLTILACFVVFVIWNGGVVLGDKSNHVATIHLPQLLYLFAFTAFFSLPLLITPVFTFLKSIIILLELPSFPRLRRQYFLVTLYTTGALVLTLGIIKYNTIIHPFTLADNRHYVFYVFRYTILHHPLIRYVLAPIYLACAWAAYLTLCPLSKASSVHLQRSEKEDKMTRNEKPTEKSKLSKQSKIIHEGPKTSFVIIFILTTALSLITAPLVEPRYFIIPWVIWRLHVPSLPVSSAAGPITRSRKGVMGTIRFWTWEEYDYRLWLETIYFLCINIATGYIFLYKGFEWPQEAGKVQRFMW